MKLEVLIMGYEQEDWLFSDYDGRPLHPGGYVVMPDGAHRPTFRLGDPTKRTEQATEVTEEPL